MMRTWAKVHGTSGGIGGATISVIAHAGLIAAWVISTLPPEGMSPESLNNRPYYIAAPDRVPTQGGSRKSVRYVKLAEHGEGTGEGRRSAGSATPVMRDETLGQHTKGADSVVSMEVPTTVGPDSVYSVLDVDTAVVRSSKSAAPAYPLKLLEAHIQGFVNAQYVVDTAGFADTTTFQVLQATHKDFVAAVRDVLPLMRFQPAKIGSMKVRQLVQQQFSFKINDTNTVAPKKQPQ